MFGCVRSVSLSLDTSTDLLLSISNLRLLLKFWSDLTMIEENEFEGGKESCSAHSICSEGSSFLNPLLSKQTTDGLIWTDLSCEFRYNQNLSSHVKP